MNIEPIAQGDVPADLLSIYRNAVTSPDGFPDEVDRVSQGLEGTLDPELFRAIALTRAQSFEVLGSIIEKTTDTKTAAVLKLTEPGLLKRLEAQAQAEIEQREASDLSMRWTQYLPGSVGKSLRSWRALQKETGTLSALTLFGETSKEKRIQHRVEEMIRQRFANRRRFEDLEPEDQKILLEEIGNLTPNVIAFDLSALREWAEKTPSTISNKSYLEILKDLMGEDILKSETMIPLLAYLRGNSEALQQLEEEHKKVYQSTVEEKQKEYDTLAALNRGELLKHKRRENEIKEYQEAAQQLKEIGRQLRNRALAEKRANQMTQEMQTTTDADEKRELQREQIREKGKAEAAEYEINDLISTYHSKYNSQINNPTKPAFEKLPPLKNKNFAQKLNEIAGNLENTYEQKNEAWKSEKENPYNAQDPNHAQLISQGITRFQDLEEKTRKAQQELGSARNASTRTGRIALSPEKLLWNLNVRRLQAQNRPEEECQFRATLDVLLWKDLVDSRGDLEVVRTARHVTQGKVRSMLGGMGERLSRMTRIESLGDVDNLLRSDERLSFEHFKISLLRDERFKQLNDLSLKTTSTDIIGWIHAGKLKEENLPILAWDLELLAQDRTAGKGNLKFQKNIRPLLWEVKIAYYREKLKDTTKHGMSLDQRAEALCHFVQSQPPLPTPGPGVSPPEFEARREQKLRLKGEQIQRELEEAKAEGDEKKKENAEHRMQLFNRFGSLTETVVILETIASVVERAVEMGKGIWNKRRKYKPIATDSNQAETSVVNLKTKREKKKAKLAEAKAEQNKAEAEQKEKAA